MERGSVRGALKRRARHLVDRVVLPYVEPLRAELEARRTADEQPRDEVVTGPVVSDRFHNLNHTLRTIALEASPKVTGRVLSVGASGRWYFDWFESCVGPVAEHIGVEAFEEEPTDLPAYVTWVPSTADRFEGVADGTVDLVFAGQTIEHLWAGELAGCLLEAHRVLVTDGWFVIDSPNRLVTEHLDWSHGGHTIEVSAAEMTGLLELAGFRAEVVRGIWRCRFDDRVRQLEDGLDDDELVARRIATGGERPDDSFVWWIEARRTDDARRGDELRRRVEELFEEHWDTRVCRGMWEGPPAEVLHLDAGDVDVEWTSLPFPVHAGHWSVGATLSSGRLTDLHGWGVQIVAPAGNVIHDLPASAATLTDTSATWTFEQPELMFALALRLRIDRATGPVDVRMPLQLHPSRPAGSTVM